MRAASFLVLNGFAATLIFSATKATAQAIPLAAPVAARYDSLPSTSKSSADHLFYLMIYERRHDLKGALLEATTLSGYRTSDVTQYRESFRSSWLRHYVHPSRVMIVPQVPNNPEALSAGEWSYASFLRRSLDERFIAAGQAKEEASFIANALDLLPMSKSPGFQSLIKGAKLASSSSQESGSRLLSKTEIADFYATAIALEERMAADPDLKKTVEDFVAGQYGDRITDLEALGASAKAAAASAAAPTGKDEPADELKKRQDEAIAKIKGLIDEPAETSDDAAQVPADEQRDDVDTFEYNLGEIEGGASIAINILQFFDPEGAARASFLINNASQVARLYSSFESGAIGPWAFAGGYFTIALAVMNGIAEEQEKAATFAMLQDIAKAISALHKDMLENFSVVNSRFNQLVSLNVTSFATVEDALERANQLASEGLQSTEQLTGLVSQQALDTAYSNYSKERSDAFKAMDGKCAFLATANNSSKTRECIRLLITTLMLDSRALAKSAQLVLAGNPNPYVYDHSRSSDAYLSAELAALGPLPSKIISYGGSQVVVPGGLPDLSAWLLTLERLRWETEVNKMPLSVADATALKGALEDGQGLEHALIALGRSSISSWNEYTQRVNQLEALIRKIIARERVTTVDGLPLNIFDLCQYCAGFEEQDDDPTFKRIAKRTASAAAKDVSPFSDRLFYYKMADGTHSSTIAADPQQVVFRRDVDGSTVSPYESLPQKLRDKLGLGDLLELQSNGMIRIYVIVSDIRYNDKLNPRRGDACGPVQGGSQCAQDAFLTGRVRVVASTAPLASADEIIKAYTEAGLTLVDTFKSEYSTLFPVSKRFDLFDKSLQIATPYPITSDGGAMVVHRPDWPQIMAYVYRDLDRDDFAMDEQPALAVLRNDVKRGGARLLDLLGDIYRAVYAGMSVPDGVPSYSLLSQVEVKQIRDVAAAADDAFARAAFIHATNVYPNRFIEDFYEECRVTPESVLALRDHRWWFYLDYGQGYRLTSPKPDDRFCFLNRGGFFPPQPAIVDLVRDWNKWLVATIARIAPQVANKTG